MGPAALAISSCSTVPACASASSAIVSTSSFSLSGSHGDLRKCCLAPFHSKREALSPCLNLGPYSSPKYCFRAKAGAPQRPTRISQSIVAAVAEKASEYNISSGGGSLSQSGGDSGSDSEEFAGYQPWGGNDNDTAGAVSPLVFGS